MFVLGCIDPDNYDFRIIGVSKDRHALEDLIFTMKADASHKFTEFRIFDNITVV